MKENQKTVFMKHETGYDDPTFYHFVINSIPIGVITVDSARRIIRFLRIRSKNFPLTLIPQSPSLSAVGVSSRLRFIAARRLLLQGESQISSILG
jgi:hypothetical protein